MKPKVLIFVGHFWPGYKSGGPTVSVREITRVLKRRFDCLIVTSDTDEKETEKMAGVVSDTWTQTEFGRVIYLSRPNRSFSYIRQLIQSTEFDVMYLNSFFATSFSIFPMLTAQFFARRPIPALLAPRGEFSAGALGLKPWRKRAFITLARSLKAYRTVRWHASTDLEAADIRAVFGDNASIEVAIDPSPMQAQGPSAWSPRPPDSPLRLLFLSRIVPMKNLEFAIEALGRVSRSVSFTIAGPPEDKAYWDRCLAKLKVLPSNITYTAMGSVPPEQVAGLMRSHDLFFLPTRGENFGHVIAESLAAGTPVLTSDRTSWTWLSQEGAGWTLPLERPDLFSQVIEEVWAWDPNKSATVRNIVADAYVKNTDHGKTRDAYESLFGRMLSRESPPV